MSILSIGSLIVETYEIIYGFFLSYKCLVGIFCDFDETTKNLYMET